MRPLPHHPDATTKLVINWTPFLRGASISSVAWDAGNVLTASNTSVSGDTAIAYLTGGTLDDEYDVECKMTTNDAVARVKVVFVRIRATKQFL